LLQGRGCLQPGGQPGWFGAVELDLLGVHIKNRLVAPVAVGDVVDTVHLPTASLDWTTSPRFELGYRLGQGFGEFLLTYRSLVTEGKEGIDNFDPAGEGFLKSRLNMNIVDLDYASREFSPVSQFGLKWHVGARLASAYFDSTAVGLILGQRTSSSFFGGGPHAGFDLSWRPCALPALSVFTRLDGALLLGRVKQSFEETVTLEDGSVIGGAANQSQTQAVPVLQWQAGVGYTPPWSGNQLHFSLGYDFEQWWGIRVGDSRADLTAQGIFLRAEFNY
jgi:hypothetical protein